LGIINAVNRYGSWGGLGGRALGSIAQLGERDSG